MAEVAGNLFEVYVLAGATPMTASTGAKVLAIDNASFKDLCNILEKTAFGDTHKMRMGGLKDTELSLSGNYYAGDTTGQAVFIAGDTIMVGAYPSGPTAAGRQVECIVESVEQSATPNDKVKFSVGLAANGAAVALPART
jgi:hypothetical protein